MGRQHNAPFFEALQMLAASEAVPFSTPGHKRGKGSDSSAHALFGTAIVADVPHGGGVDTTHLSHGHLRQAELLAAEAYGGDDARFLVNGSTTGNLAMLMATCSSGDEVIVSRMLHKSLMAGLIFSGARPIYIVPELDRGLNLPLDIDPGAVDAALGAHPGSKAVVLVSPSYVGVSSDLVTIARVCHRAGVPLLVDEAWGPHFHFHPDLPASAMASGADATVSSTHKMLSALTQGSTLVARKGPLDLDRLHTIVDMVQTTSPSALIFASLDVSRRQIAREGVVLLGRTLGLAARLRDALSGIEGLRVLGPEVISGRHGAAFDPTRVMVDVHGLGLTGYEVEAILRAEAGVFVEMSDLLSVMLLVTIGDDNDSISRAVSGFQRVREHGREVDRSVHGRSSGELLFHGVSELTPREAFMAEAESVPVHQAIGRVVAESITPYPPGIPIVAPGERLTVDIADYLRAGISSGMYISGMSDVTCKTVRVVR